MADPIKEFQKLAEQQQWVVEKGTRHWRFIPPSKDFPIVVVSATPSDHRALKNIKSDLRKSGLQIS